MDDAQVTSDLLNRSMPAIFEFINASNDTSVKQLRMHLMGLAMREQPFTEMTLRLQANPYKPELTGWKFTIEGKRMKLIITRNREQTSADLIAAPYSRQNPESFANDGTFKDETTAMTTAQKYITNQGGTVEVWRRIAVIKSASPIVERDIP